MSNRVEISVKRKVGNLCDVQVADNHARGQVTLDLPLPKNDIELLRKVRDEAKESGHEAGSIFDMFQYLKENEMGMTIRDSWHTWEQIKECLSK